MENLALDLDNICLYIYIYILPFKWANTAVPLLKYALYLSSLWVSNS